MVTPPPVVRPPRTSSLLTSSPSPSHGSPIARPTPPGRVKSQTPAINFSRPFEATRSPGYGNLGPGHAPSGVRIYEQRSASLGVPDVEYNAATSDRRIASTSALDPPRRGPSTSSNPAIYSSQAPPRQLLSLLPSNSSNFDSPLVHSVHAVQPPSRYSVDSSTPSVGSGSSTTPKKGKGFWSKFKSHKQDKSISEEVPLATEASESRAAPGYMGVGHLYAPNTVGNQSASDPFSRQLGPTMQQEMQRSDYSAELLPPTRPGAHKTNSIYSNYSVYSLPPDSPINLAFPSTAVDSSPMVDSTAVFGHQERGGASTNFLSVTVTKAKAGLASRLQGSKGTRLGREKDVEELKESSIETPDDLLQLAIQFHEEGELERAAWYFERAALEGGGSIAYLLWGLTLRHGWGTPVNLKLGFEFIQRAAELVVDDLDAVVHGDRELSATEMRTKAVQNVLVLALHEVGTSYRFGEPTDFWPCISSHCVSLTQTYAVS